MRYESNDQSQIGLLLDFDRHMEKMNDIMDNII